MLIDYNQFEFIQYKDYLINHEHNIQLLETLSAFIDVTKSANLNYYLTGSISLSLLSNKVYRTWTDVDIIVDEDSIHKWLKFFPKKEWYYLDFNKNLMKIYYTKHDNYVEFSTRENHLHFYDKKYLNIQDYNGIKVANPKPMFFWKKNVRKNTKQHDIDDELFYKQYLDI